MKIYRYIKQFSFAVLLGSVAFVGLSGCGARKPAAVENSRMAITFPSASQLRSISTKSVSAYAQTYDFSKACFAVNVTGAGISETVPSATCELAVGVFQGFVPPGGSITMEVPNGTARRLEVIAYARGNSSEPCPTGASVKGLNVTRLAEVGLVESFDAVNPDVVVEVQLKVPSQNLAERESLPQSCRMNPLTPLLASTAITLGREVQTGGGFKLGSSWNLGEKTISFS